MRRGALAGSVVAAMALLATVCEGGGSSSGGGSAASPTDPGKVTGTIKVLTQRTDLVQDGTMKKYAARFNKIQQEPAGHRQDRHDVPGLVGHRADAGCGREGRPGPLRDRLRAVPCPEGRALLLAAGPGLPGGGEHPLLAQGRGPRVDRLVHRQVRLRPGQPGGADPQGRAAAVGPQAVPGRWRAAQ